MEQKRFEVKTRFVGRQQNHVTGFGRRAVGLVRQSAPRQRLRVVGHASDLETERLKTVKAASSIQEKPLSRLVDLRVLGAEHPAQPLKKFERPIRERSVALSRTPCRKTAIPGSLLVEIVRHRDPRNAHDQLARPFVPGEDSTLHNGAEQQAAHPRGGCYQNARGQDSLE